MFKTNYAIILHSHIGCNSIASILYEWSNSLMMPENKKSKMNGVDIVIKRTFSHAIKLHYRNFVT